MQHLCAALPCTPISIVLYDKLAVLCLCLTYGPHFKVNNVVGCEALYVCTLYSFCQVQTWQVAVA